MNTKKYIILLFVLLFTLFTSPIHAQQKIEAFIDYDYDGWVDVFFDSSDTKPYLKIRNDSSNREDIFLVEIIGKRGERFEVNLKNNYGTVLISHSFIPKLHIRVLVRGDSSEDDSTTLYAEPSASCNDIRVIQCVGQKRFAVVDFRDNWLLVSFDEDGEGVLSGWIPLINSNANPY